MATTGAVGGSQIDARSLAQQLVQAERASLDARITRQTAKTSTQISALGALKGALSTFRTALTPLKTVDVFSARKAVTSDKDVFTATTTSAAASGSYTVEVERLAKAHQLASTPFAGGSGTTVGTGTLTIALGAESFNVVIDSSNSTLAQIRDAINAAPDNKGVQASILNTTTGARLVLTSSKTGAANTIAVTQSGGDGNLVNLTYGAGNTANYTQASPAQDARVYIATFPFDSPDNSVDGAIDGVTLNLVVEKPGTVLNLTVSKDTGEATKRINAFVTAYNAMESQIAKLRSFDPTTRAAGPLLGDALLTGTEADLRRVISEKVVGAPEGFDSLASIGITTKADGTLQVDDTKLQKALSENFDAVAQLFGGENGVAAKLDTRIEDRLESGAALDARTQGLVKKQRDLQAEQTNINARMERKLQQYIKQFTALDTLLSRLSSTSAYLGQQLANLPKAGGGS